MTKLEKKNEKSSGSGTERRRTRRRPILATFSVFLVIPKKGLHRLSIQDISEEGVGFEIDVEGEEASNHPVATGDTMDVRLYLNTSLYICLTIQVTRVETRDSLRLVGAEFREKSSPSYKAFLALLQLLDNMADLLHIDPA